MRCSCRQIDHKENRDTRHTVASHGVILTRSRRGHTILLDTQDGKYKLGEYENLVRTVGKNSRKRRKIEARKVSA